MNKRGIKFGIVMFLIGVGVLLVSNILAETPEEESARLESDEKEKTGSQNLVMEPMFSSDPFNNYNFKHLFKSFYEEWNTVGWQNLAMRLPIKQVGSLPSGFKTSFVEVPALPSIIDKVKKSGNQ